MFFLPAVVLFIEIVGCRDICVLLNVLEERPLEPVVLGSSLIMAESLKIIHRPCSEQFEGDILCSFICRFIISRRVTTKISFHTLMLNQ